MSQIAELIKRVEGLKAPSNELDVLIEVALFVPHISAAPNSAGTKVVYPRPNGKTDTFRAGDYTLDARSRERALALLRSMESDHG